MFGLVVLVFVFHKKRLRNAFLFFAWTITFTSAHGKEVGTTQG